MPRWLRFIRGMVGTALTFATLVGGLVFTVGLGVMIFGDASFIGVLRAAGRFAVAGFVLGILFSGVLASVARGRSVEKLSYRFVTALGAGGGLIYFAALSANAWSVWTPRVALLNFALLLGAGSAAAAGMLFVARNAGRALRGSDNAEALGEGASEPVRAPATSRTDAE